MHMIYGDLQHRKVFFLHHIQTGSSEMEGVLGQFEYDEEKKLYQQTNMEKGHEDFEAVYLYFDR